MWVRGCIAKKLCVDYEGRIIGDKSEMDVKCCGDKDKCNDHDYTVSSSTVPLLRISILNSCVFLIVWILALFK